MSIVRIVINNWS